MWIANRLILSPPAEIYLLCSRPAPPNQGRGLRAADVTLVLFARPRNKIFAGPGQSLGRADLASFFAPVARAASHFRVLRPRAVAINLSLKGPPSRAWNKTLPHWFFFF